MGQGSKRSDIFRPEAAERVRELEVDLGLSPVRCHAAFAAALFAAAAVFGALMLIMH